MTLTILAGDTPLLQNTEFWVAMAFIAFMAILGYYGIHKWIANSLDARSQAIRREIEDARKLREEAQALLADYQRRAARAEVEANEIVERAETEAKAHAENTRKALQGSLERRTRMAEEKIARAEELAVNEVRAAAVDRAVGVAEILVRKETSGDAGHRLISDSIEKLPNKLS